MTGIVRTRCHFVGDDGAVFQNEEFDAEDARVVKGVSDFFGVGTHFVRQLFRHACGYHGFGENAVFVVVFKNRERDGIARHAAGDDDGHFGGKRKALFQNAGYASHLTESGFDVVAAADRRLSFAVVAQARGFQNAGKQVFRQVVSVRFGEYRGMRCHRNTGRFFQKRFFRKPILCDGHGVRGRRRDAGIFARREVG